MPQKKIQDWHFRGKKIIDMSKNELIEVIRHLSHEIGEERKSYERLETFIEDISKGTPDYQNLDVRNDSELKGYAQAITEVIGGINNETM